MKRLILVVIVLLAMVFVSLSFAFDGKCPICKKEGLKSTVSIGGCWTTLLGFTPSYDEDGKYHSNDPNITTCDAWCSNGHSFTAKYGDIYDLLDEPEK